MQQTLATYTRLAALYPFTVTVRSVTAATGCCTLVRQQNETKMRCNSTAHISMWIQCFAATLLKIKLKKNSVLTALRSATRQKRVKEMQTVCESVVEEDC